MRATRQAFAAADELLEREAELEAVEELIGAVGRGGRLLAIEGPPGIGKTSLVTAAKRLGQAAGLRVQGARGSELERSFSYGVVRQLFEPLLASGRAEERAGLLTGAAALASSVFDPRQVAGDRSGDSSLATLHGLYWLTANLAERQPLLIAVDDLHWSDLASLRWLAYLLPRVEGLPLVVLAGLRPEGPSEDQALVAQIVSDPLAAVIRPGTLSIEATAQLLRDGASADVEDAFVVACHQETGGNPLLLRELVRGVAGEGVAPLAANASRVHGIAARAGSRAVTLRLAGVPRQAASLAQSVAVLGDDADPGLAGALAGLDGGAVSDATDALARVEVLRSSVPLAFVHPLIGAAVYETLPAAERERAHARVARLLLAAGAEPERVAAHVLRSPPSGDSAVVATLRVAARRAGLRGASESAVAYLRRALAEPPPEVERAELLAELGAAEAHLDGEAAIQHLRAARDLLEDPIQRARIALVLGRQLFFLHDEEAESTYTSALQDLAGADPELGHLLEAGLIHAGLFVPSRHEPARLRVERIRGRIAGRTMGEKLLLSLLAFYDALSCAAAGKVIPEARLALADGDLVRADVSAAVLPLCTVLGMADLDEALIVFEDVVAEAHRRGSMSDFAAAKVFRAQTLLWRGDLGEAEAESREALAVAGTWGSTARFAGHATAFLGDSLMEQGRLDDAATALSQAQSLPESARMFYLRDSSTRLRILRGDLAGGAAERLDACQRFEAIDTRNPALIAWRSPAALALLQLGERDEARRVAAEELELARDWGTPRALGAALRAAGVVESGKPGLAHLGEALELLSDSPAKLEHAKARIELGAALRRAGHRVQAREHLRRAVELARICGATPLAARAETELLATGARPRRIALSGVESLTPSERRVAELAAQGPTNREIAQALFVTQRTVEVHLTSIFRKLDITSRSQLAAALDTHTGA
ncbi:MAG: AAA family ATPase [Solirubrobacterales bacterium]|nr:AAA family ATPase [Solirubrobacterales bacterium]MBV9717137.1 AAA family ATPase [Solirubrobacterales bacterium]